MRAMRPIVHETIERRRIGPRGNQPPGPPARPRGDVNVLIALLGVLSRRILAVPFARVLT